MSDDKPNIHKIACGCGNDVGFVDSNDRMRCAYCGSTAQVRVNGKPYNG